MPRLLLWISARLAAIGFGRKDTNVDPNRRRKARGRRTCDCAEFPRCGHGLVDYVE